MLLAVAYTAIALWLSAYGLNALILAALYLHHARGAGGAFGAPPAAGQPASSSTAPLADQTEACDPALPAVTVQVPVYNERHVIERAIDAVASLEYPQDRLQIQIIDDSTDETTRLARQRAAFHRRRGLDIALLRRPDRTGFKAGALAWGLDQARGDVIAIFDADFRPHPDFLMRTVPLSLARPRLGIVQVRWSHLNAATSPLTRAQAMAFDGHFVVEQTARDRSGLLMNFNGTAGLWRRACIEESGGWEADTLSEDLDLSYRAQLAGWETRYLPEVDAPAELPPQIAAFKRQQARWAQGAVQTLRKLAAPILRNRHLTIVQKGMALLHLSGYLSHALIVLLLVLTLPLLLLDVAPPALGNLGLLMGLGPPLVYVISQQQLYADWGRRLLSLPLLVLVGIGTAWNNTLAIWRGLTRWGGTFERTPKFHVEDGSETRATRWASSAYRLGLDRSVIGELALAIYALLSMAIACGAGRYGMMPFLLLCAAAFSTVAAIDLAQASRTRHRTH
ncbi:MAG: glycosyltransferase [Anaerolineae bacterium]|jgi:cellulose synthase/poly-beta-1,6-N-acetylglucosamine synthase-like glycosyltransferase